MFTNDASPLKLPEHVRNQGPQTYTRTMNIEYDYNKRAVKTQSCFDITYRNIHTQTTLLDWSIQKVAWKTEIRWRRTEGRRAWCVAEAFVFDDVSGPVACLVSRAELRLPGL